MNDAIPARKIGVLGGTFDPIHNGHLAIGRFALRAAGLDEVVFVPAGRPWMKQESAGGVSRGPPGNGAPGPGRRNAACPVPTST